MNYSTMVALYKNKFKEYTSTQVAYAIRDCHETLVLNEHNPEYCVKLWIEIDALRDHGAVLNKICKHR